VESDLKDGDEIDIKSGKRENKGCGIMNDILTIAPLWLSGRIR